MSEGEHNDGEIQLIHRFGAAPFAVLATHGPDGRLDLVPCCFAVVKTGAGVEVVSAVDHKPKRHQRLARLANIARDPNVAMIVDHRDAADWSNLWWVRLTGRAIVVDSGRAHVDAIEALVNKYAQYRATAPQGPVIRIRDLRWSGWLPDPQAPPSGEPGDGRAS